MSEKCPKCGAKAVEPQPLRYIGGVTVKPEAEWACGTMEIATRLMQTSGCEVAALEQQLASANREVARLRRALRAACSPPWPDWGARTPVNIAALVDFHLRNAARLCGEEGLMHCNAHAAAQALEELLRTDTDPTDALHGEYDYDPETGEPLTAEPAP